MTANKPESIGYVVTKNGRPACGEDGFTLDDFTAQLRDNPAGLKLEEVILLSDHESRMAVLFDGYAVYSAMTGKAKQHTSYESVAAVLDAVVKLMREVKHDNQ